MAGLVTMRQRPETASGATFVTLEDEDGMVNVVVCAMSANASDACCSKHGCWQWTDDWNPPMACST